MTIIIDEKFVATWYIALDNNTDWMLGLRHVDGKKYRFDYRFRYYRDAKTFGSDDEKSWYAGTADFKDREEAIKSLRDMARHLGIMSGGEVHELVKAPEEKLDAFMDRLTAQPWAHPAQSVAGPH